MIKVGSWSVAFSPLMPAFDFCLLHGWLLLEYGLRSLFIVCANWLLAGYDLLVLISESQFVISSMVVTILQAEALSRGVSSCQGNSHSGLLITRDHYLARWDVVLLFVWRISFIRCFALSKLFLERIEVIDQFYTSLSCQASMLLLFNSRDGSHKIVLISERTSTVCDLLCLYPRLCLSYRRFKLNIRLHQGVGGGCDRVSCSLCGC